MNEPITKQDLEDLKAHASKYHSLRADGMTVLFVVALVAAAFMYGERQAPVCVQSIGGKVDGLMPRVPCAPEGGK